MSINIIKQEIVTNPECKYRLSEIVETILRVFVGEEEFAKMLKDRHIKPNIYYVIKDEVESVYKQLKDHTPDSLNTLKSTKKLLLDQRSVELILEKLMTIKFRERISSTFEKYGIFLNPESIERIKRSLFGDNYIEPQEQ